MSQLGNINKSYGKSFAIAIANANDSQILSASGLPANTLIISSPMKNGEDTGVHSIFATDYNGTPVQLSYNVILDNCFVKDENDNVYINIDNKTIIDNNGLAVNIANIIDGKTIVNNNGKMRINTQALPSASENTYGVAKYDGHTIKRNNIGEIYVETPNIEISDNNILGICMPDNITTKTNDGVLSVNTSNLQYATSDIQGVVKGGDKSISIINGIVTVNYDSLNNATEDTYGVSMPDNVTIIQKNDKYSVGSVEIATDKTFGVVQSDFKTTIVKNGVLSFFGAEQIEKDIDYIDEKLTSYKQQLINLLSGDYNDGGKYNINKFEPVIRSGCALTRCMYGVFPDSMTTEFISNDYLVNTNCPFYINISISNNVTPTVYINKIIFDGVEFYGTRWKTNEFPSTHGYDKNLTIEFGCKNFANSSSNEETVITNATISIVCSKDNSVLQETKFGIIRYNSLYYGGMVEKPTLVKNVDGSLRLEQSDLQVNETKLLTFNKTLENSNIYGNYTGLAKDSAKLTNISEGKIINSNIKKVQV